MIDDRYLLVRAATIYIAAIGVVAAALWRRPDHRARAGALLGFAWNVPAIFAVNLVAIAAGWWHFDADGGELLDIPVDLWLAWAVLWGAVPALAAASWPLGLVAVVAFGIDLIGMPAAWPVVQLGPQWLAGEVVAIAACLVPGLLLARWTASDRRLLPRALLQVIAFTGLMLLLVVMAIHGSGSTWINPLSHSRWMLSVLLQLLAIPAVLGLSAVQEFVTRGLGTPVPFDPPRRLVTSGPYAYVANPMQLSAVVLFVLTGIVLGNVWVALAGVAAHIYSAGIAGWDEREDLRQRFGEAWRDYRANVRAWRPRWRPWVAKEHPATLHVSAECGMCSQVGDWFRSRGATGLVISPAESYPQPLTRITYCSADGHYSASGIAAIARALEHIHFGWAMAGFTLRLPVIAPVVQLIVDASGGGPRLIRSDEWHSPAQRPD